MGVDPSAKPKHILSIQEAISSFEATPGVLDPAAWGNVGLQYRNSRLDPLLPNGLTLSLRALLELEIHAIRNELISLGQLSSGESVALTYNPGSIFSGGDPQMAKLLTRIQIAAMGFLMKTSRHLFAGVKCIAFDNFSDQRDSSSMGSIAYLKQMVASNALNSTIDVCPKSEIGTSRHMGVIQVLHHNGDGVGFNETFEPAAIERDASGNLCVWGQSLEVIAAATPHLALTTPLAVEERYQAEHTQNLRRAVKFACGRPAFALPPAAAPAIVAAPAPPPSFSAAPAPASVNYPTNQWLARVFDHSVFIGARYTGEDIYKHSLTNSTSPLRSFAVEVKAIADFLEVYFQTDIANQIKIQLEKRGVIIPPGKGFNPAMYVFGLGDFLNPKISGQPQSINQSRDAYPVIESRMVLLNAAFEAAKSIVSANSGATAPRAFSAAPPAVAVQPPVLALPRVDDAAADQWLGEILHRHGGNMPAQDLAASAARNPLSPLYAFARAVWMSDQHLAGRPAVKALIAEHLGYAPGAQAGFDLFTYVFGLIGPPGNLSRMTGLFDNFKRVQEKLKVRSIQAASNALFDAISTLPSVKIPQQYRDQVQHAILECLEYQMKGEWNALSALTPDEIKTLSITVKGPGFGSHSTVISVTFSLISGLPPLELTLYEKGASFKFGIIRRVQEGSKEKKVLIKGYENQSSDSDA